VSHGTAREDTVIESVTTVADFVVPKAAQVLAQSLKADILAGRAVPGQMLPAPDELARTYQVSRPTVREALNLLESQAQVRLKRGPNGGAIVQRPDHRTITRALAELLEYERVTPEQVIEVRQMLEPAAAALAATRITPAELRALQASIDDMSARLLDRATWLATGISFHLLIFRATQNPVLSTFMDSLSHVMRARSEGDATPPELRPDVLAEHRAVMTGLLARDAEAAERAMSNHVRGASNRDRISRELAGSAHTRWFD
jgi:DNA-binding FadR family transcriptional regulator